MTRIIPNLYQLAFETHTEDVIIAARPKVLGKRKFSEMAEDFKMTECARQKIQKRVDFLSGELDEDSSDSPIADETRKTRGKPNRSKKTTPLKLEETL